MLLHQSMSANSISRSRSPVDRRMHSDRFSYRNAPYKRESHRVFSQGNLCKNCKRPGHFARECPNVAICHNCGLSGHIASECSTKSLCWNCREPGHMANECHNEGICHTCGKAGGIKLEIAQLHRCHLATRGYATIATSKGISQPSVQTSKPVTTAEEQDILLVTVQMNRSATRAILPDM